MLPKISVVVDDRQWALLQVDKNQPGAGAFIDVDAQAGIVNGVVLQRFFQESPAEKAQVCLGISHQDLIIRAFVVPEMSPAELNKAIIFEIKKYIPFNITEAYYSTLTFPFIDNNNKMMRVLFYAARKATIDKYKEQLAKEGLVVTRCEPAICGLVRTMIFRKDIHPADKIALLDIRQQKGVIYFIDAGVVKFVREISLAMVTDPAEKAETGPVEIKERFLNGVHNSFDFYFRQFGEHVAEMLVVSNDEWFASLEGFMSTGKIKCRKYSFSFVSGVRQVTEFTMSCAFGLGLTGNMFVPPINFLTPQKSTKKSLLEGVNIDVKEFVPALRLAVGIVILLSGVAAFLWHQKDALQKQLAQTQAKQNEFAAASIQDLQGRIISVQQDIKGLQQAPSQTSQHMVLLLIAQHMPQGMWLQEVNISYSNVAKGLGITLKAAVYAQDVSQQARLVNKFLSDLKNDKQLAQYVLKWQLKTMNRQQAKNVTITVFDLISG